MLPGGSSKRIGLPVFLLLIATPLVARAETPTELDLGVRLEANRAAREIAVIGLDPAALDRQRQDTRSAGWPSLCPIIVRPDQGRSSGAADPILGTYRVDGSTLRFVTRYPLDQPGYRVLIDATLLRAADRRRLDKGQETGKLAIDVELKESHPTDRQATVATAVYPSAKVLPENLLRFYIHFSAPMSRGEAYRHIHLLDAAGKPVADPFLELDEELWSGDGCRFTLLFDPGRIKRGLKPREEVGPVLEQEHAYTLVIDRAWPDAQGKPIGDEYRRQFQVGPPDQTSPAPRDWSIQAPAAGSRDPLTIRFPEPLDSALARRLILVEDGQGLTVKGEVSLTSAESVWMLTPETAWKAGSYRLVIGTELEDLAGNAINRPFEVDRVGPISRQIEVEKVLLPFEVRPVPR